MGSGGQTEVLAQNGSQTQLKHSRSGVEAAGLNVHPRLDDAGIHARLPSGLPAHARTRGGPSSRLDRRSSAARPSLPPQPPLLPFVHSGAQQRRQW